MSCGTDVNVLFEWFDPAVQLPATSKGWDDRLKPVRRTLVRHSAAPSLDVAAISAKVGYAYLLADKQCTYSGWSATGASRIKFGGPVSDDQSQIETYSSAWNNHNLDPMEWFICKDLDLDPTTSLKSVTVASLLSSSHQ